MSQSDDGIDWSLTTWEGSRRAQLRDWMKLTLTQKWTALEAMCDHARATIAWRRRQGLPYIDPSTHERIPGRSVIREERPEPGGAADNDAIPADWREEFEAAARRPLALRMRYAFIKTYKPVLDDAPFRAWNSTAEYRRWCERNLPDWLGYGRV
jgi:hypothetical protein